MEFKENISIFKMFKFLIIMDNKLFIFFVDIIFYKFFNNLLY